MNSTEIKHILHITAILTLCYYFVLLLIIPTEGHFHNALYAIDLSILTMVIISKWLWHHPPFKFIFKKRPYVAGKWIGSFTSDYNETTKNSPVAITIYVRQSLYKCCIRTETAESISYSIDVSFIQRSDDAIDIVFTYKNEPGLNIQDISRPHYGTTILHYHSNATNLLSGCYFTDRKTSGTIQIKKAA